MTLYIVTIKLKKSEGQERVQLDFPNDFKKIGGCRYNKNTVCDDCDGQHHSFAHLQSDNGRGIADGTVRELYEEKGYHVTRVEME